MKKKNEGGKWNKLNFFLLPSLLINQYTTKQLIN
jgi:hypothetical protein